MIGAGAGQRAGQENFNHHLQVVNFNRFERFTYLIPAALPQDTYLRKATSKYLIIQPVNGL